MDKGVEGVAVWTVDAGEAEEVEREIEGSGEVGPESLMVETWVEGRRWRGEFRH